MAASSPTASGYPSSGPSTAPPTTTLSPSLRHTAVAPFSKTKYTYPFYPPHVCSAYQEAMWAAEAARRAARRFLGPADLNDTVVCGEEAPGA